MIKNNEFKFWKIFAAFLLVYFMMIYIGLGLIHIVEFFDINPINKMFYYSIAITVIWVLIFTGIKKLFLKFGWFIIKEDFDKVFALVVCIGTLYAFKIAMESLGVDDDNVTKFANNALKIIFAIIPSILVKPFLINDKIIVKESCVKNDSQK